LTIPLPPTRPQVFSLGALAVRGDGSAAATLRGSSRATGNMLQALGLAALGGDGKYSSDVKGGEVRGRDLRLGAGRAGLGRGRAGSTTPPHLAWPCLSSATALPVLS
jgi:hypothetical protein